MRDFKNFRSEENSNTGMTMVEFLVAVCILGLIMVGFSSIDTYIHYHVVGSDRRAKMQNALAYVLEHMQKNIGEAVGNNLDSPAPVAITTGGGVTTVTAWIDFNSDGNLDSYPTDRQIAYQYSGAPSYEMRYYSNYIGDPSYEVLSNKIYSINCSQTDDYIYTDIVACWDPTVACGNVDNPALEMKSRIHMPSVSTH